VAAQVGQVWGRQLAAALPDPAGPVDATVTVLGQLGFDPHLESADRSEGSDDVDVEVHLRTCPFLELVGRQPDVMCALHAGVIRGVLRNAGAPHGEAVLEPFAAPNACVAHLRMPTDHSGQQ